MTEETERKKKRDQESNKKNCTGSFTIPQTSNEQSVIIILLKWLNEISAYFPLHFHLPSSIFYRSRFFSVHFLFVFEFSTMKIELQFPLLIEFCILCNIIIEWNGMEYKKWETLVKEKILFISKKDSFNKWRCYLNTLTIQNMP